MISFTMDMKAILSHVLIVYTGYWKEKRSATLPVLLEEITARFPEYTYNPGDSFIRETLMEHVGSLPILASLLYPYINDTDVDLGRALAMLSIHDIGEIVTGDTNTFLKESDSMEEDAAARKLIHPSLIYLYDEFQALETKTAKFAKSIDKINPNIVDLLCTTSVTKERSLWYAHIPPNEIVTRKFDSKHKYMTWNPFLSDFDIFVLQQLEAKLLSE